MVSDYAKTNPLLYFSWLILQNGIQDLLNGFFSKVDPDLAYIKLRYIEDRENGIISYVEPQPDRDLIITLRFNGQLETELEQNKQKAITLIYEQLWATAKDAKDDYIEKLLTELDYLLIKAAGSPIISRFPQINKTLNEIQVAVFEQQQRFKAFNNKSEIAGTTVGASKDNGPRTFLYLNLEEDPEELRSLYNQLRSGGYISNIQRTESNNDFWENFSSIFSGKDLRSPIQWLKDEHAFAFFIKTLWESGKLESTGRYYNKHWKVAAHCFRDENGNIFSPVRLADISRRLKIDPIMEKDLLLIIGNLS